MADPIADERDRRQSMAQQMMGLADDWEAEYDGDEDLNPNNIPKPVNDELADSESPSPKKTHIYI
jgi:hypothetical protein